MAITWTPSDPLVATITKPNSISASLSAAVSPTPSNVEEIITYTVSNLSVDFPDSIILTPSDTGIVISGDTTLAFSANKKMDYLLGKFPYSATEIGLIPYEAIMYKYKVDERLTETHTFDAVAHVYTGATAYTPGDATVPSSLQYSITVLNSWEAGRLEILSILAKNYELTI